jgi:hypothetical protein
MHRRCTYVHINHLCLKKNKRNLLVLVPFLAPKFPLVYGALAVGTIGELIKSAECDVSFCGIDCFVSVLYRFCVDDVSLAEQVLAAAVEAAGRDDETSQVNGAFCIGVLFMHGGAPVHSRLLPLLQVILLAVCCCYCCCCCCCWCCVKN